MVLSNELLHSRAFFLRQSPCWKFNVIRKAIIGKRPDIIGEQFDRFVIEVDMSLYDDGRIGYEQIHVLIERARKDRDFHLVRKVFDGQKAHRIAFFCRDTLGLGQHAANAHDLFIVNGIRLKAADARQILELPRILVERMARDVEARGLLLPA